MAVLCPTCTELSAVGEGRKEPSISGGTVQQSQPKPVWILLPLFRLLSHYNSFREKNQNSITNFSLMHNI